MSLQVRLFAAFGALIAMVLLAQWLVIRHAKQQIAYEFGKAALALTEEVSQTMEQVSEGLWTKDVKRYVAMGGETNADGEQVYEQVVMLSEEEYDAVKIKRKPDGEPDRQAKVVVAEMRAAWDIEHRAGDEPGQIKATQSSKKIKFRLDDPDNATYLHIEMPDEKRKIALPNGGMSSAISRLSQRQMMGSGLVFLLGLMAAAFLANRESRPLRELAWASNRLGTGEWGTQIPKQGGGLEIRQAILAFNQMSARVAELNRQADHHREARQLADLSDIARGLAHTLRNPLNTLGLSIEELAGQSTDPKRSERLVAQSRRQIKRIDRWIRSFLALASEGKGQVEAVDLGALLQDIALEVMHQDRIRIQLEVSPQLPQIAGVAPELRAVIQAFVVNAVEASEKGGQVQIVADASDDTLRIDILDRGVGISAQIRSQLFTPHLTTKANGSGMGLFLARKIASNRYDGNIQLLDRKDGGTHAQLTLPLRNSYE